MSIRQQVKQTADYFKSFFQDSEGNNYMPDIDPYYWFRYARNIIELGHPGDIIKDGRSYDTFQLAPNGRYIEPEDTFHPYSIAYLYRILGIFNPKITLMQAEMLYPVIVSALTSILVFLIARRIIGNIGGLFAGAMMALNPASLTRSLYGHGDSDTWVLFISVLATFLFLEALEAKKLKWQLGFAALSGLTIGVYARFWGGWWYIFDFLIAAAAIYAGYFLIAHRSEIKKYAKNFFMHTELKTAMAVVLVFALFSGISVSLLAGPEVFLLSPVSSLGFTRIKAPVMESLWPNVLTTVAELNEGDINGIINNVGGIFLLYVALLGIVLTMANRRIDSKELMFITISATYWLLLLLLRNNFHQTWFIILLSAPIIFRVAYAAIRTEPIDMKLAALLIIWFMVTIYASTKGIRFVMLLAPAFSIAFGVTIGFLYRHLSSLLTKEMHINRLIAGAALLIISATIFIYPTNVWAISNSVAKQDAPIINDAWYNSLTAIRDSSNKTAIITSWWDFGHHFKALAERPVTFDGTTQGSPQAHWVGQMLRTDNEKMAVGILRMLDCGGNNAFEEVQKTNDNDTVKSVKTLYDIFEMDKDAAKSKLLKKYGMTEQQAEKVLSYSHCEPPEAFFIASEDMIGKAGVWAHFGSWNFERAYAWQKLKDKTVEEAAAEMQSKFNYTREQAEQTYFDMQAISNDAEANSWVSPWPSYGQIDSCTRQGKEAVCNNGMRINLTTNDVYFYTAEGVRHPKSVTYLTETDVRRIAHEKDVGIDLAATYVPEGDGYKLILAAPELNASMFTKMFFMRGHSLKHFKLLTYQRSITGAEIYTYKVDWKGGEPNVKEELVKKDKVRAGYKVSFNYIGYLEDGTVFDSSVHNWQSSNITKDHEFDENTSPFTFTVGTQEIIPGLEEEMMDMKKGEERVIKVPPEKAYGLDPAAHPLGNKTLYFKTRIEEIK
ncbi:FKBP-type peptidyl-prolyl cis-trans isomerase [Candidatus Woesearchaeota archaeon]|nr:FKBP-type peptidyl-prolyl cis-trans isomerase [Candidatus Woesearchaeota archaeon]